MNKEQKIAELKKRLAEVEKTQSPRTVKFLRFLAYAIHFSVVTLIPLAICALIIIVIIRFVI